MAGIEAKNHIEKYSIFDTGIGPLVDMPCFLGYLVGQLPVDHTRLGLDWRYRAYERRANNDGDFIKEKIGLTPIQVNGFFGDTL